MLTMLLILIITGCYKEATPAEIAATAAAKEHNRYTGKCRNKVRGSRPECWDEKDWEVFCQHVQCKEKQ